MATKVTTRKFKIVDLIRYKTRSPMIEVPKYPVEVVIDVTTSKKIGKPKEVPSAKMDRLEKAARTELERYESIITSEIQKFELKIQGIMATPGPAALKAAEQEAKTVSVMVKNALDSAKGSAITQVEKTLKKEAQGDKLLTEARVKTGVKVGVSVISIGTSVAKLVATAGADVTSYLAIAKKLYSLGQELNQQLKGEKKLRKDLFSGVQAYLKLRETTIMQAARRQGLTDLSGIDPKDPMKAIKAIAEKVKAAGDEILKGRDAKGITKEVFKFIVQGVQNPTDKVKKARVAYRNHVVKMRQKTDSISAQADKLMKAMRAAKTLKEGVKIGAECMNVKRRVRGLGEKHAEADTYLNEIQELLKGNGITIDDQTIIQKLQSFNKATILTEGKELLSNISTVYNFVSQVVKIAA